jgi:hypothetical protein
MHINSDFNMRTTEIVEPVYHEKHPQEHSPRAIGKRKLPSFITHKTTIVIAKTAHGQHYTTPQFAKPCIMAIRVSTQKDAASLRQL